MRRLRLIRNLILVLLLALSLFLSGCHAGQPTGPGYQIDENLLGKEYVLNDVIDFSKIEQADHAVSTATENRGGEKKVTSEYLDAKAVAAIITQLKHITAKACFISSVSPTFRDDCPFSSDNEFKTGDTSLGHVRYYVFRDKTILIFDLNMLKEELRHPSVVFVTEDLKMEEET